MSIRPMTVLTTLLALPGAAAAQATEQQQPPPEVQEWIAEVQEIQKQLAPVEQEALQDPAIQESRQNAADAVREAMIAAEPTVGTKLDRMAEITEEARVAQAAGDEEKVVALTREARTLQPAILAAQEAAFAQPAVEAQVQAFRDELHERMVEIDPEAEPLLDRMIALNRRIEAALRSG